MRKKIAVRPSVMRFCFACLFPSTEENATKFSRQTDQGSLDRFFSPGPLEIETVVATSNRSDIEKISFVKLESGNLTLQFHSKSVAYTLSEELVRNLSHINEFDAPTDGQTDGSIELIGLTKVYYQTLEGILSKCPQGEVIGCDEFEKQLKTSISENLKSPILIVNLYKALDYFGYSHFEAFEGLKLFEGIEITFW